MVSGAVNPDHFVVDTATGAVLERRLGDKRSSSAPRPGGGTERVARAGPTGACLTDDQVRALVALGDRVEAHYGAPQDTEWAIDARRPALAHPGPADHHALPAAGRRPAARRPAGLLLLQRRPGAVTGRSRRWASQAIRVIGSVGRHGLFGFPVADPLAGPPALADAGGRLFFDVTAVVRSRVGRAVAAAGARRHGGPLGGGPAAACSTTRGSPWSTASRPAGRCAGVARGGASAYRVPLHVAAGARPPRAARARRARHRRGCGDAGLCPAAPARPSGSTSSSALLGEPRRLAAPGRCPPPAAGFAMLGLAGRLLGRRAEPGDLADRAARPPAQPRPRRWTSSCGGWPPRSAADADGRGCCATPSPELGERYRAGSLPPVAPARARGFLARYGHRAVAEIDIGVPRWAEDPAHILGVLANYLRLDDPATARRTRSSRAARARPRRWSAS